MGVKIQGLKKDKIVRELVNKNELKMLFFKYQMSSLKSNEHKQFIYWKFLRKFHLNSSVCRIVNRCVDTGRSHWVLRKFRFARMTFREYADFGRLNGVRKSSW